MNSGQDPNHQYEDWFADYDGGAQDGFCDNGEFTWPCMPYSYVQSSDVGPYFSIATNYGFANYMFQTNEGPSFEAHQFLFSGTSSPVAPLDANSYYWDFVEDNAPFTDSGCPVTTTLPKWIQPDRTFIADQSPVTAECYAHDTLVTAAANCSGGVCDRTKISWRYYAPAVTSGGIIWNAPEAIPEVCYGENDLSKAGQPCGGTEWNDHVTLYSTFNDAPIFNDINNCKLAQISWVIPDRAWSDHPFSGDTNSLMGPSWVGDIVNAIGLSYANSNQTCDYWGTSGSTKSGVVQPTAILIVWDDWGGFYDHIAPLKYLTGQPNGTTWLCKSPATNSWGCGYTYGFRVPFLVVSEYTPSGYVSGSCAVGSCPNTSQIYQHDFGSILAFTEFNFSNLGLGVIDQAGDHGYADQNTTDSFGGNIPLSDFFQLYKGSGSKGRSFAQIPTNPYPASFFQNYYATHSATPTGPDTD